MNYRAKKLLSFLERHKKFNTISHFPDTHSVVCRLHHQRWRFVHCDSLKFVWFHLLFRYCSYPWGWTRIWLDGLSPIQANCTPHQGIWQILPYLWRNWPGNTGNILTNLLMNSVWRFFSKEWHETSVVNLKRTSRNCYLMG